MMHKRLTSKLLLICSCFALPVYGLDATCILSDGINVQTQNHTLTICEHGQAIKKFDIAIGKKGVGKRVAGDKKTPVGLYELDKPRRSWRFGIFIPVQYPTPQQMAEGFSGKDIGIHGPIQHLNWLGSFNTWFDWTHGCIAVSDNSKISYIAQWVAQHPGTKVYIES